VPDAVLIVNPNASRVTPEVVAAVERALGRAGPVETVLTERPGHATEIAAEACSRCGRIYVLAGDGGFNEAVNGMDGEIPIAFLPGGGSSVLPRALGLPRDPVECAHALAGSERLRRISLGRVNGRRFTFAAGLGLDAEIVRSVDRLGRAGGRRPGDLAFVWALIRIVARRYGRFEPAMNVLGRRVAFVLVANCDPYTYFSRFPVHVAPEARFELGLDVVAPERLRVARLTRLLCAAVVRPTHLRDADIAYAHDADRVRVECDAPTPLQADGEDLGDVTEALFEAERGVLDVVVG
jgi:diacylglycerol kinase family enzyme